jgi:hypothetical protein
LHYYAELQNFVQTSCSRGGCPARSWRLEERRSGSFYAASG